MKAAWLGLALLVLAVRPALALDLGAASGVYDRDGVKLAFSHSVALIQDNAEGALDHPNQVRVLLSDREVPPQALEGLALPPVRAMARAGEVRGLLLEFDPADRTSLQVTVLARQDDPDAFLPNISLSDSEGLWKRLELTATRAVGDYPREGDGEGLAFGFSAPVFTNPVVADLKGPAAASSEQVRVLVARAEAVGRGDLAGVLAVTAKPAQETLRKLPPGALKSASAEAPAMIKALKAPKRVVVRRDTAAVLTADGSWASLVLEDGAWKIAD